MPSRRGLALLCALSLSGLMLLNAAWIPLKAQAAQWLIERSWSVAENGGTAPPPWPWADTRPLAVLEVPSQGVRLFVLEGTSGRNLAFGPTLASGTGNDRVISGHRDTHFGFVGELELNDRIRFVRSSGTEVYEVVRMDVADSREAGLRIAPGKKRLSLVTCYPFNTLAAGGPLRYVVTALPVR